MPLFAGVDVGTSTLKILVVDEKGNEMAISQAPYDTYIDGKGLAEQDPADWCRAFSKVINDISKKCDTKKIISMGFSGQMHGMVAIDKDLKPVRKAIIWMDQRTAKESKMIKDTAGENLINSELLNYPSAGMFICSLLWTMKNEPNIYKKIYKVISPKDYLRLWLTGVILSEETDASATLAFSVKNREWSKMLIDKLGIDYHLLADVKKPYQSGGKLKKDIRQKHNLSDSLYVALGGGDSSMQLLGNGIVEEGIITSNIGTASQVATVISKPVCDDDKILQTWCHVEPSLWYIQGGSLNGGSAVQWLKKNILKSKLSYKEMDEVAGGVRAGSNGLIFLPYLSGERTPYLNPKARGCFIGFNLKHNSSDMIRAVMEGITYNLKESMTILEKSGISSTRIIASGGGSKGFNWKQIQADMFGLPVYTTKGDEEACLGAAITGAVGCGYFLSVKEACKNMVKLSDYITMPIADNVEFYKEKHLVFKDIYEKNKEIFPKL